MFCYSFGAILLWLNVLSAAALQYEQEPKGSSNAMLVYTSCMSWFLLEYMFFEHVHLYTYDIFRERLGKCMVMPCVDVRVGVCKEASNSCSTLCNSRRLSLDAMFRERWR